jgi:hypothetical protein
MMKQESFEQRYQAQWRTFEQWLWLALIAYFSLSGRCWYAA